MLLAGAPYVCTEYVLKSSFKWLGCVVVGKSTRSPSQSLKLLTHLLSYLLTWPTHPLWIAGRAGNNPSWYWARGWSHPAGPQWIQGPTYRDKQAFTLTYTESPMNLTSICRFLDCAARVPKEKICKHANSTQKDTWKLGFEQGPFLSCGDSPVQISYVRRYCLFALY